MGLSDKEHVYLGPSTQSTSIYCTYQHNVRDCFEGRSQMSQIENVRRLLSISLWVRLLVRDGVNYCTLYDCQNI